MKKLVIVLMCVTVLSIVATPAFAAKQASKAIQLSKSNPNLTNVMQAVALETYETVLNKYKVAYYFWYDTFADGEIPAANVAQAKAKLDLAKKQIDLGTKKADMAAFNKAKKLMADADKLLGVHKKSPEQFPYKTDTPLVKQDASKVYKAKAADYTVLERYGVKMNDVGPSIWGLSLIHI